MSMIWGAVTQKEKYISDILEILSSNIFNSSNGKENSWIDENIGFFHKLKQTTQESLYEVQPLLNSTATIIITADARLDNRDVLFQELPLSRATSKTITTDADLILYAYEKWGTECPLYLIGDYSFAIWDIPNSLLFCARDHLGIKPFFFRKTETAFYFSSGLFSLSKVEETFPNTNKMKEFLNLQSSKETKMGETFYKDIFSLPPGNTLILQNDTIVIERYWKPEEIKINKSISFNEAKNKFLDLFKEAISCRMRSAFPIGFELSGGLDSSSIVCVADDIKHDQLKMAFISRYGNYHCDEGIFSHLVMKKIHMKAYEIQTDTLDYHDQYSLKYNFKVSPDWPRRYTFIQSFPLSKKMNAKNIRVVITGQGGDDIMTGNFYRFIDYIRDFQLKTLLLELYPMTNIDRVFIVKKYLLPYLLRPIKFYLKSILKHGKIIRKIDEKLFNNSYSYTNDLSAVSGNAHTNLMDSFGYNALDIYNIEYRHPFYDVRLVEFMLSLPAEYKMSKVVAKKLLKEAMKGILPEGIRIRTDKAEFSEAILDQLKAIDLDKFWQEKYIVEINLIEKDTILRAIENYINMKNSYDPPIVMTLWKLINIEYWYRINFVPIYQENE